MGRKKLQEPKEPAPIKVKPVQWDKRWATGSELDLLKVCPAAAALDVYEKPPTYGQKHARLWGKCIHKWVETGDVTEASKEVDDDKKPADWLLPALGTKLSESKIDRDKWWPSAQITKHEAKFVWTPDKEVVRVDGWFPEVPGSLRLIVDVEYTKSVEELKTGFFDVPIDTMQLAASCAVAGKVNGYLTTWRRYPLEGLPDRKKVVYDGREGVGLDEVKYTLTTIRKRSMQALEDRKAGRPLRHLVPGEHCEQCKRKLGCPAWQF
jgi:hypothetical protein